MVGGTVRLAQPAAKGSAVARRAVYDVVAAATAADAPTAGAPGGVRAARHGSVRFSAGSVAASLWLSAAVAASTAAVPLHTAPTVVQVAQVARQVVARAQHTTQWLGPPSRGSRWQLLGGPGCSDGSGAMAGAYAPATAAVVTHVTRDAVAGGIARRAHVQTGNFCGGMLAKPVQVTSHRRVE